MLRKLFGGGTKETWSDRAKAHRSALREEQEVRNEAADGGNSKPKRRSANGATSGANGRKGFGRRG